MLKQITLKHFAGKGWPDLMMMEKAKRKTTTKLYFTPELKEKSNLQSLVESHARSHWLTRSPTYHRLL